MSAARIQVAPVASRRDQRAFRNLPYRLHADEPRWIPPLRMMEKAHQDPRRNAFFRHGTALHLLARRGGQVVGRVAAIHNPRHNETHDDRMGFFGLFDAVPDVAVTRALLDAAQAWVADRGLDPMMGPVSYSTNEMTGVLVDGFDDPPMVLMPWNDPGLDGRLQEAGLAPAKDLLAFWIPATTPVPERFRRVVDRRLGRSDTTLRPIDVGDLDAEIPRLLSVYNRSWERNWGFVPATAAEFEAMARDMKPLLDTDLSAIAERGGEPVGFSIVIRDLNELLGGTGGRLWRALPRLLLGMRRIRRVRIVALGVVPEARGGAINEAFFIRAIEGARAKGLAGGEAGWVLEDNDAMQAPIRAAGGEVTKRYRLYERRAGDAAIRPS